jgi:hypothetical protein
MNIAFEIEACTNADGDPEIVSIECDPTSEDASDELEAEELSPGTWQLQFVVPATLEGNESLFRKPLATVWGGTRCGKHVSRPCGRPVWMFNV